MIRYAPLIRLVAWIYLICRPLFLWIDSQAGLPKWWMAMDTVGSMACGAALLLACHSRRSSF